MKKAIVFLSCGQQNVEENKFANGIEKIVKDEFNLECYNANSVQGFDDVMSITNHLAKSDYYLFIDFKRSGTNIPISVFTHQEFALARAWGIDKILAFQENGLEEIQSKGMIEYVLAHPIKFERNKLLSLVKEEIKKRKWDNNYSRNLVAVDVKPTTIITYNDHTGQSQEKVWHLEIHNNRNDKAAVNTVAILHSIIVCANGTKIKSYDRSYLKWAQQSEGYQHTILPMDSALIDAFAIRVDNEGVFLHSRLDWHPRNPVIKEHGKYIFIYHIYSEGFPLLEIPLTIEYNGTLKIISHIEGSETTAILGINTDNHSLSVSMTSSSESSSSSSSSGTPPYTTTSGTASRYK